MQVGFQPPDIDYFAVRFTFINTGMGQWTHHNIIKLKFHAAAYLAVIVESYML